jgi:hypothetical protein
MPPPKKQHHYSEKKIFSVKQNFSLFFVAWSLCAKSNAPRREGNKNFNGLYDRRDPAFARLHVFDESGKDVGDFATLGQEVEVK